jgi:hypothetical protein
MIETYCGSRVLRNVLGEYTRGNLVRHPQKISRHTAAYTITGTRVDSRARKEAVFVPLVAFDNVPTPVELSRDDPILGSVLSL